MIWLTLYYSHVETQICIVEKIRRMKWSEWSECSTSCGDGERYRERACYEDNICDCTPIAQRKRYACPKCGIYYNLKVWTERSRYAAGKCEPEKTARIEPRKTARIFQFRLNRRTGCPSLITGVWAIQNPGKTATRSRLRISVFSGSSFSRFNRKICGWFRVVTPVSRFRFNRRTGCPSLIMNIILLILYFRGRLYSRSYYMARRYRWWLSWVSTAIMVYL